MEEKNKVPRIRFPGFAGSWEQRKFGELYEKRTEKNDLEFDNRSIISVANMYFKEDLDQISDDYLTTYNKFYLGDIAFEGNKSKNFAHGRFVENTIGNGIVSHVFDVFRPISQYDLWFWKYYINNESVMGSILIRSTKSSTMMTNLVASDFLKETILVPKLKEQQIIGAFFKLLDETITLRQQKLEQTKKLKSGLLQKMFPTDGGPFPQVRFPEFTSPWEQRKLGDLGKLKNGMNFSKDAMGHGYPFVNLQNVFGRSVIDVNNLELAEASEKQRFDYSLECGDVLFVRSSVKLEGVGEAALVPENLIDTTYSGFLIRFRDQFGLDNRFKQIMFTTDDVRKQIMNQATNSANKNISQPVLENLSVQVPELKEQQQIGAFFQKIDDAITLHQREIDILTKLKKGLLQQMFV